MRINPYDDVMHKSVTASSVAIQSFTGSSAVNQDSVDTLQSFIADSIMVHVRAEIASGSPAAATLAWKLQESDDNSAWADAKDNTGTTIGATLNVLAAAVDSYARVEGIGLQPTGTAPTVPGGRKRYLRIVLTPAFTSGTSPAILAYAELIGSPANGQPYPVRTAVSNT
jgi:hypothetical protein